MNDTQTQTFRAQVLALINRDKHKFGGTVPSYGRVVGAVLGHFQVDEEGRSGRSTPIGLLRKITGPARIWYPTDDDGWTGHHGDLIADVEALLLGAARAEAQQLIQQIDADLADLAELRPEPKDPVQSARQAKLGRQKLRAVIADLRRRGKLG